MSESRYHIRFADSASGEELGLMLTESPQLGFNRRLVNPYAAKAGQGATEDTDLTEWSVVSQRDWRGGRGQEEMEDDTAFLDAWNVETRIDGQVTLGPLPQNPGGTVKHEPGSATGYAVYNTGSATMARAQSFTTPVGGLTCTLVQLYLGKGYSQSGDEYTVSLCSDNGGVPGTVLKSKVITPSDMEWAFGFVEVVWGSGAALTGSTLFHITLEPGAGAMEDRIYWGCDVGAGYGDGSAFYNEDAGGWTGMAGDFYFRVNRPGELNDLPVAFARYKSKWYCAAGDTVYVWNDDNKVWDVSEQVSGTLTALEVWGKYLWAARGSAILMRRYNGAAWEATAMVAVLLLKGGGYLHLTLSPDGGASPADRVYYTANGTDWSDAIEVGAGDHAVTGMVWYRDMLVCATATRLWGIAAEMAYPMLDWSSQEDLENGRGMVAWGRTGCLYIPLRFGLYRWNGDTMVAVGPEQGTGLPAERAGKIAHLVGTGNWLYAAVDAGAGGKSSILAYNGMGGWHELQRAEQVTQRIRTIGFETVHSPNRLWFGMGKETRYLMLPDYSDNPWQWSGYEFNASGELETSWFGGALLEVVKDLQEVVIRGEGIASGQPVAVYYEVDRSGAWTYLGQATNSPREALAFEASDFAAKVVGSGSTVTTIELGSGATTDMSEGDWCRIDEEVRQVASITDGDTFVLETALSAAPVSSSAVYASRPAGREFRLKLVLATDDKTETPKVKAVFVRYQNNVLDRFVYTLNVRVEDGLRDLAGNPYPYLAADLRVELDRWTKRVTSFVLYDPDGVAHTVKVTSAGEGGMKQVAEGALPKRYGSTYALNLVEVE